MIFASDDANCFGLSLEHDGCDIMRVRAAEKLYTAEDCKVPYKEID